MTAAIYKFLVSDFLDPLLIPLASPGSAEEYGDPPTFPPHSSSESFIDLSS